MLLRSLFMALAGGIGGIVVQVPDPAQAQEADGRLVYQLQVTQPGTRSQGWFGTLYDEAGAAVTAEPGATVKMPFGTFENLPCTYLWSQCELTPAGMLPVAPMTGFAALTEDQAWFTGFTSTAKARAAKA